jgi:3-hydroxymyristoyl/3-hydroxydecanoyl-(acyl carrier protein) dehydratase
MTVNFDKQHPSVQGHFDARPIIPGVTLLASVIRAITEQDPSLTGLGYQITAAKFLHPVEPPALVEISLVRKEGEAIDFNFECRLDNIVAAKGAVRFAN